MPEPVKKTPPKEEKKGLLGKLKDAADDKEEQLFILSAFVRLGILIWSGGILTLAYVDLPPAATPKVAKVPVKTEAIKVGSILSPLS